MDSAQAHRKPVSPTMLRESSLKFYRLQGKKQRNQSPGVDANYPTLPRSKGI